VAVICECHVRGVSARRVDGLVRTQGLEGISKSRVSTLAKTLDTEVAAFRSRPLESGPYPYPWLDALAVKAREEGRVVSVWAVVATAVSADGHREISGIDVLSAEDGAAWTQFLRGLVAGGSLECVWSFPMITRALPTPSPRSFPGASGRDVGPTSCEISYAASPSRPSPPWPHSCAPSSPSHQPKRRTLNSDGS
jgi:transposase-like protein